MCLCQSFPGKDSFLHLPKHLFPAKAKVFCPDCLIRKCYLYNVEQFFIKHALIKLSQYYSTVHTRCKVCVSFSNIGQQQHLQSLYLYNRFLNNHFNSSWKWISSLISPCNHFWNTSTNEIIVYCFCWKYVLICPSVRLSVRLSFCLCIIHLFPENILR